MVSVTLEPTNEGDKIGRVVYDGDPDTADLDLVFVLANLGGGVCEIKAAKGEMRNVGLVAIGLKAIEEGYKVLRFYRTRSGRATRWARKVRQDERYSYYEVDLVKALQIYESRGKS
jgi:hypothetical protein